MSTLSEAVLAAIGAVRDLVVTTDLPGTRFDPAQSQTTLDAHTAIVGWAEAARVEHESFVGEWGRAGNDFDPGEEILRALAEIYGVDPAAVDGP